jgi:hypothetical protein
LHGADYRDTHKQYASRTVPCRTNPPNALD